MKKIFRILSICCLCLVMILSQGCSFKLDETGGKNAPLAALQEVSIGEIDSAERNELDIRQAIKKVERSVVAIAVTTVSGTSAGAGVIIDASIDGAGDENVIYIATCHHVIASKGDIVVYIPNESCHYYDEDYTFSGTIGGTFASNSQKAVTLVGGDVSSDVAVIKVDLTKKAISGNKLPLSKIVKATIAKDTYSPEKGEEVFAIGNPTGELPGWVSNGIVSSLEESVSVETVGTMKLMGISVTTNPGNSGGGLFNLYGELIGITNAGNTSYEAINFAIPMHTSDRLIEGSIDNGFVNIVKQLMGTLSQTNYGYVAGRREMFGFTVTKGTTEDLTGEYPYVYSVNAGSLAEKAGILKDDVIKSIKINGESTTISSYNTYISLMDGIKIGDVIVLTVDRQVQKAMGRDAFGRIIFQWVTESKQITLTANQYYFCDTRAIG